VSLRSTEPAFDPAAIPGPIVVSGAGGFVGVHVLEALSEGRDDVIGFGTRPRPWRHEAAGPLRYETVESGALGAFLDRHQPRTIINLAAAGAYPFQNDSYRIPDVNVGLVDELARWSSAHGAALIHAGSSSEYGTNCAGPAEDAVASPNSLYAATKLAAANLLEDYARRDGLRARVLRLYSVYGPLEEPRRLVPEIVRRTLVGELPPFADPKTTRDFVFIDDVVDAFVAAALSAHDPESAAFRVYNVASGEATSMVDVAQAIAQEFEITAQPVFSSVKRAWDLADWYGDPRRINAELGWRAAVGFREGLRLTADWYRTEERAAFLDDRYSAAAAAETVAQTTTPVAAAASQDTAAEPRRRSISAVIACYKDGQAIPYMHRRLTDVFVKCGVDYEIIFVNDASPDDSAEVIRELSEQDEHVIGITHRRNFGSQAAFLSGMRESTGDAVVLLDGDLQDPPEMIEQFVEYWNQGYEVVYGHRVDREAPLYMRMAYRGFYRVFNRSAPFHVPTDAGDFSLMDRRVVDHLLEFPERDPFLRALRAYVGGKQIGVDYVRPERMFGTSTNNLARNLGWATKGILAVSKVPLSLLSTAGVGFFALSMLALLAQAVYKMVDPNSAPHGITILITLVVFLGSLNLLAISIVGAYVGTILEEAKRRPRFMRDSIIRSGRVQRARLDGHDQARSPRGATPTRAETHADSDGDRDSNAVPAPRRSRESSQV
jgi:dolichol-phosphate mannosyltransferase